MAQLSVRRFGTSLLGARPFFAGRLKFFAIMPSIEAIFVRKNQPSLTSSSSSCSTSNGLVPVETTNHPRRPDEPMTFHPDV